MQLTESQKSVIRDALNGSSLAKEDPVFQIVRDKLRLRFQEETRVLGRPLSVSEEDFIESEMRSLIGGGFPLGVDMPQLSL